MAALDVSVVIPSWRRPDMLRRCLEGVKQLSTAPSEVLVVARPDDAETLEVIEQNASWVRLVAVTSPGHVAPIAAAVKEVRTRFVAFLDDDAVPRTDWLTQLFDKAADPSVACVGGHAPAPKAIPPRNKHPGKINWLGRLGTDLAQVPDGGTREVDTVQECNWMWRVEVLRSLSFDRALQTSVAPNYGLDLTLQAKRQGWRVLYEPTAVADHFPSSGADVLRSDRIRAYARNMTYITLKHRRRSQVITYVAWAVLVGERASLGVGTLIVETFGRKPAPLRRFRAAMHGRIEGFMCWRRGDNT